jgi:hypothetical protein
MKARKSVSGNSTAGNVFILVQFLQMTKWGTRTRGARLQKEPLAQNTNTDPR